MACGLSGLTLRSLPSINIKGGFVKLNKKQKDLKDYMIKNDLILEDVVEVVAIDAKLMNPPGIYQMTTKLQKDLNNKLTKEAA